MYPLPAQRMERYTLVHLKLPQGSLLAATYLVLSISRRQGIVILTKDQVEDEETSQS
jgi:hypothetical protein